MSKRPSLTSRLQKLDEIVTRSNSPLDAIGRPATASGSSDAAMPQSTSHAPNTEETLSTADTVQSAQCSQQTVSTVDSVQNEQLEGCAPGSIPDSVQGGYCEEEPDGAAPRISEADSVQDEQGSKRTVSATDLQANPTESGPRPKFQGGFTQVPNSILRTPGLFEDPFDFMIYMLLYSYSYGFGRDWAFMSQSQIEEFGGVSKNRVKRSLDRLVKQRWVKLDHEYERARVARKWKVTAPENWKPSRKDRGSGGSPEPRSTVFKTGSVHSAQCPPQTLGVSTVNTPTLSKTDTFQESIQTKLQRNSLSQTREIELTGTGLTPVQWTRL